MNDLTEGPPLTNVEHNFLKIKNSCPELEIIILNPKSKKYIDQEPSHLMRQICVLH